MATPDGDSLPRVRRLPRWLRWSLWTLLWFVTLLTLAIVIENWLGAREWRAYVDAARGRGEPVELAAVVPPPAADAENFAAIPLFAPLFDYERAAPKSNEFIGHPTWKDPAAKERLETMKPFGNELKSPGKWRQGIEADLREWQQHLAREFPDQIPSLSTPGGDILRALARFDADLEALRAAAPRPRCRFPIGYEEHISVPLSHLNALLAFGKITRARALAHLSLGNPEAACADLVLGLRIANATREEPLLISQLVIASQVEQQMQPLWEGLNRRQWTDPQLASIEAALARFDLLSGFLRGIRGERSILGMQALDAFKQQPQLLFTVFDLNNDAAEVPFFLRVSRVFLPAGWIDFNKAEVCRHYDRLAETVKPEEHRFLPQAAQAQEKEFTATVDAQRANPRRMIAALVMPQLSLLQQRCAAGQATVDLARVAVAIARHRLRHAELPSTLDQLVPDFLPKVPPDVITGEPLRYRPHPDGTFALYSVGWDAKDDGGEHALKANTEEIDWQNGDWPWPGPPKAPLAE